MTYQPKTSQKDRDWLKNGRQDVLGHLTTVHVLDDLAACEAALAEEQARIAELEAMVRELVEAVDQCFGNVAISMDDEIAWANTRRKALAMLQPDAGKEVGR